MKKKIQKLKKERGELKSPSSLQEIKKEEKPFDFGGLPIRDLKKNLGCG